MTNALPIAQACYYPTLTFKLPHISYLCLATWLMTCYLIFYTSCFLLSWLVSLLTPPFLIQSFLICVSFLTLSCLNYWSISLFIRPIIATYIHSVQKGLFHNTFVVSGNGEEASQFLWWEEHCPDSKIPVMHVPVSVMNMKTGDKSHTKNSTSWNWQDDSVANSNCCSSEDDTLFPSTQGS